MRYQIIVCYQTVSDHITWLMHNNSLSLRHYSSAVHHMWFSVTWPRLSANSPDSDTYWASQRLRVFDCDTVDLLLCQAADQHAARKLMLTKYISSAKSNHRPQLNKGKLVNKIARCYGAICAIIAHI